MDVCVDDYTRWELGVRHTFENRPKQFIVSLEMASETMDDTLEKLVRCLSSPYKKFGHIGEVYSAFLLLYEPTYHDYTLSQVKKHGCELDAVLSLLSWSMLELYQEIKCHPRHEYIDIALNVMNMQMFYEHEMIEEIADEEMT